MPRPSLTNVSTAALQAEIERRISKLADLLKLRDDVDRQIADLEALAGRFGQAVAVKAPSKMVVRNKGKRGSYAQTAPEFVLSLLAGGKVLTTADLKAAWAKSGRGSKVDNALTGLVKSGQVERSKVKGGQGSTYSLAAGREAVGKKPAAKAAAARPVAKRGGKRTFACPTCKQKFASGMQLGVHYKAEPAHRAK